MQILFRFLKRHVVRHLQESVSFEFFLTYTNGMTVIKKKAKSSRDKVSSLFLRELRYGSGDFFLQYEWCVFPIVSVFNGGRTHLKVRITLKSQGWNSFWFLLENEKKKLPHAQFSFPPHIGRLYTLSRRIQNKNFQFKWGFPFSAYLVMKWPDYHDDWKAKYLMKMYRKGYQNVLFSFSFQ